MLITWFFGKLPREVLPRATEPHFSGGRIDFGIAIVHNVAVLDVPIPDQPIMSQQK